MFKKLSIILIGLILIIVAWLDSSLSSLNRTSSSLVDVSWPNCRLNNRTFYSKGIIGVTGGLDFHPNKCLSTETAWFSQYSLYMNTGYPGGSYGRRYSKTPLNCQLSDQYCLAYNYGFNAAKYALNYAALSGAKALNWWLDVETDNSWTNNPLVNRQVLLGATTAISQYDPLSDVGFYSFPAQWQLLTGNWHNYAPAWVATGSLNRSVAVKVCQQSSFSGGTVKLSQYTNKLDINLVCHSTPVANLFN